MTIYYILFLSEEKLQRKGMIATLLMLGRVSLNVMINKSVVNFYFYSF